MQSFTTLLFACKCSLSSYLPPSLPLPDTYVIDYNLVTNNYVPIMLDISADQEGIICT